MPDFSKRRLVQAMGVFPFATSLPARLTFASSSKVTREFDISAYQQALLPREHGQLVQLKQTLIRRYPSREQCMQMAAFFNAREGLLVIANDPTGGVADWEIRPGTKLRIHFYGDVPDVKIYRIKPTLEAAAELYREWALNQFWVRQRTRSSHRLDFVVVASNSSLNLEKQHIHHIKSINGGSIAVWFTQWRRHPFDRLYPDYTAKEPAQFAELLTHLADEGILAFPYINSMLWDERLKPFQSMASQVAALSAEQEPVSYNRQLPFLRYACPQSTVWHKNIVEARNSILDATGKSCNGIYLDMLAAAAPIFCHHNQHGHKRQDAYAWQHGLRKLLEQTRGAIMVEGCAEVYLDLVDYLLMHLYTAQADQVPLWSAVYGDLVQTMGWNIPAGISESSMKALIQQAGSFGVGAQATPWMTSEPEASLAKRVYPSRPHSPEDIQLREIR